MEVSQVLSVVPISVTLALIGCSISGGTSYAFLPPSVTISPQITSVAVNGNQSLTAAVKNTPSSVGWFVQPSTLPGVDVGSFSPAINGFSGIYFAPPEPPIYSSSDVAAGAVQGSVTLSATVADSLASNLFTKTSLTFAITGPISVHLSPPAASLALGATQQFAGYAVGSTTNTLIWQVNGFSWGSQSTGTITNGGLYAAPTAIPMSGNTITITCLSAADSTKSASSVVILNSP